MEIKEEEQLLVTLLCKLLLLHALE